MRLSRYSQEGYHTIHGTSIENERFASVHISRRVFIPEVVVNQAWLNVPAFRLQGFKQPRHHLFQNQVANDLEFFLLSISFLVQRHHMCQLFLKELRPRIFPAVGYLSKECMARSSMESKFPCRRFRIMMEVRKTRCEFDRVERLITNIPELRKQEMRFRFRFAVIPPRIQFWYEGRRCGMHFFERVEFAFCHRSSDLTQCGNLREIIASPDPVER